jgi:hypothetical protein
MPTQELLAFSEEQQQAVVGHLLQHPKIWDSLSIFGINEKWLKEGALTDFWHHLESFKKQYNRLPQSANEIVDFVLDPQLKGAAQRTIAKCVEAKKKHSWDVLERKLVGWAKSRLIFTSTEELAKKYNAGLHEEAYQILQQNAIELQKIDSIAGLEPDGFVSAAIRIKGEAIRREDDAKNSVPYSIPYLQDATHGMLPTEVILLGATSGAGKTEAAKIQAAFTAKTLKEPVHYFALEAEPDEIERRIKYGIMGRQYKEDHTAIPVGLISYANYRKNRIVAELGPYEQMAEEEFEKNYSTLYTYYRKRGDFGKDELVREMWKLKGTSRLIIVDHIHFMDLDGNNETKEMTELIKAIRDMSGILETPIMLVAHITEKGVRHQELIPRKEDFYGASNLFKVSTTAIMMSPARGLASSDSRTFGVPTFMKIVKGRLDNSLQYYPGISFFNTYTSDYTPYYSVGQMTNGNRKWVSLKGELPNWVNIEANCCDVNDIE